MIESTRHRIILVALATVVLTACTGRYRLDLFEIRGDEQKRIKIEQTEYIIDGVLNAPYEQVKVVPGQGNCVVLYTGSRGQTSTVGPGNLVGYDSYVRYRIFLQLPPQPEARTYELPDHAFVQELGRYEVSAENHMYLAQNGTLVVDSLPKHRLFGTIDATFRNAAGDSVKFQGQFKVKMAD